MKKIYILFLTLITCIGAIQASGTLVNGIWYKLNISTHTAIVTFQGTYVESYPDEYTGSVVIPESVIYNNVTYKVTEIGSGAFGGCSKLTSVIIPNTVVKIASIAFRECTGLTSVTIPASVTSIGDNAFLGCLGLTRIVSWANIPPQGNDPMFSGVSKSIPVFVPKGKINAYKVANSWKDFTNYQTTSDNQYACSCSPMKITIMFPPTPLRWEKSCDGGSSWTNIACADLQYTEANPSASSVMYRILGTDNTYSDIVTITYVDAVPSTIQALPATSTKTVDESITLTADVEDNGYSYQWKKDGTDISGATQRTYTISTIKSSHAGDYTCYVSNGCNGVTTTTAKLTVNKCAQAIDFPEIPVQTYSSGLTYTLPKTTDKGLSITYQSMNTSVATISGNTLTIKAPGSAIITATQVGNDDYLEATQISRTLTVNKRTQAITFDELPKKTYEDLPFTLPQKTDEGLTISYTSTNTSVATVSGNTVTILKPGTTDIIASQAGDATHYAASAVSQTLIVNKAVQEISFGALSSKTYGDAPFELTKVSNKNLPITYTSSDAAIASIEENVVTIKHPGTVTITASQIGDAYYLAAETKSQTLTINKANQSINLAALDSRAFDSGDFELPQLTNKGQIITYESSTESVATVSGNIVHIVGAGTTEITASQAGDEYYNAAPIVSQSLTITKATQTINFPELPMCVYGQDSVTLEATVSSGLEIQYESSNSSVATITGNKLAIIGAGTCFITASASGNKNYYTATPVERTLVVNKAQPTLTFASLEKEYTYGDSPIAIAANSSAGKVVLTSSNPAKLLIAGTNALIQGAGQFTITASVAEDANHLAVSASQTITVNKAALTVTINNATRVYGDSNPEFTYTYSGFVNGDTKADITANVQVSSVATITSSVGSYELSADATVDPNYEIIIKKGVLSIEKAPLTISVQCAREYGENNPEFVFSYAGFKNNENSSVLSVLPQAYSTAKKTSPVGSYPIYISGAEATNYSISYEEDSIIVEKAPLTITALDAVRKQFEGNPKFEIKIEGFKLEETVADLDKLPTISCEANANSPVGTYPIVLSEDGYATNYNFILKNGTLTVKESKCTIQVNTQSEKMGSVSGAGKYEEGQTITISATSTYGYHFAQWSDGNIDNPRTIIVTQDSVFEALFEPNQYSIYVTCNSKYGSIEGENGLYEYLTEHTYLAVANENYTFYQWSDGETANPRVINATQDITIEALFTYNPQGECVNVYYLPTNSTTGFGAMATDNSSVWTYNNQYGAVGKNQYGATGNLFTPLQDLSNASKVTLSFQHAHKYAENPSSELTLWVTPEYQGDWATSKWNQLTISPYSSNTDWAYVNVTLDVPIAYVGSNTVFAFHYISTSTHYATWDVKNLHIEAECEEIPLPQGTKIGNLYYNLDVENNTAVVTYEELGSNNYSGLTIVDVPSFVTYKGVSYSVIGVGDDAFRMCSGLKKIILGTSVKVIEYGAFWNCSAVESITCYSQRPPTVKNDALRGLSYSTIVYVPADYLSTYKMHDIWGLYDVRPLNAESVETNGVEVTPTETTAEIIWPVVSGVVTYELVIKDKNGNVICTLIFNAQGQLTQLAFAAPSRHRDSQQAQATGFQFTVTGLEEGTSYDYTLVGKDENDIVVDTKSGSFTTKGSASATYHTITFVNWDGTELLKLTDVEDGIVPEYTGATPTRPEDADYTYSFSGWTPDIVAATSDATYTAAFEATSKSEGKTTYYTVRFLDWDETVLKSQSVEKGKNATPPEEPTRTGYTFTGWDKDYTNVQSDMTIWAQYKIKTFTVRFLDWNDTELKVETVEYGKSATAPDAPIREGYTFKGWDSEFDNVRSNLEVRAVYVKNEDEAIDEVTNDQSKYGKFIKNGHLIILRDGTMYDITGKEIK